MNCGMTPKMPDSSKRLHSDKTLKHGALTRTMGLIRGANGSLVEHSVGKSYFKGDVMIALQFPAHLELNMIYCQEFSDSQGQFNKVREILLTEYRHKLTNPKKLLQKMEECLFTL
jgi:hypothetical protein